MAGLPPIPVYASSRPNPTQARSSAHHLLARSLTHSLTCPTLLPQVGKWGFAPGADDTLALQLDLGDTQALLEAVGQAAAADPTAAAQLQAAADGADGGAAPGASPALEAHLEGLQLADSKENLPVEAAAVAAAPGATARSLSDPVAAAAALRPLGEARAAALGGVEVEWNVEAEAAVVAAGLPEQDSFMVWVDDGEEGSPPLMGSPAGSGGSQTCAAPAAAGAAAAQPGAAAKKLEQAGTAHLLSPAGEVVAGAGFVTPVRQWPEGGAGEVPALDPFSPSFRGRMLACLEPAVAEVSLAVVLWVWQWRPWLLGVPAGTLAAIWWQQQQVGGWLFPLGCAASPPIQLLQPASLPACPVPPRCVPLRSRSGPACTA